MDKIIEIKYPTWIIDQFIEGLDSCSIDIFSEILILIQYIINVNADFSNCVAFSLGIFYKNSDYNKARSILLLNGKYLEVLNIIDRYISEKLTS